jgi:beta-1,4-mannosyltransferase
VTAASAALDAIRAIRFLEAAGHDDPILVLYYPASPANPFQRLLYAEGWSKGIAAIAVDDIEDVDAVIGVVRGRATITLHLHWLGPATERSRDRDEADARAASFLATLDRLRRQDCRIAWTVHNALPHDVRYTEAAVRVRRGVADRAAFIHVLTASTSAAVAPWFQLPEDRLVVIPHPSYAGVYPEPPNREVARFDLELWPDEIVLLAFGQLRPYKGHHLLLDAWAAGSGRMPEARRLVVAGRPAPRADNDALLLALGAAPDVVTVARALEVDEVATFFRAADVAVLSHVQALNSGVLLLALTFGLPVIAPRLPPMSELLDERVALLYEPGDVDDLAAALGRSPELVTGDAEMRAREIAALHDPVAISRRFAEELRRRVRDR